MDLRNLRHPLLPVAIAIPFALGMAGCGSENVGPDAFLPPDITNAASANSFSHLEKGLGQQAALPEARPEKLASKVAFPSPDRTNPFELSAAYQDDPTPDQPGRKREIRILGFAEVDEPRVILSIDGKTHVLKSGETEQRVTVMELHPPNARLSYDGVTWNASLFEKRTDSSLSDHRR